MTRAITGLTLFAFAALSGCTRGATSANANQPPKSEVNDSSAPEEAHKTAYDLELGKARQFQRSDSRRASALAAVAERARIEGRLLDAVAIHKEVLERRSG